MNDYPMTFESLRKVREGLIREARPLTYLALPYTFKHEDPRHVTTMHEHRFLEATHAAAWLMETYGWNVFSPITHSHPLHKHANMRGDWEFWKKIDTEYLGISKRVVLLRLPGWQESTGVRAELAIAQAMGLPILALDPPGDPDWGRGYFLHLSLS